MRLTIPARESYWIKRIPREPDGNHVGPRANASIAAAVLDALPRPGA